MQPCTFNRLRRLLGERARQIHFLCRKPARLGVVQGDGAENASARNQRHRSDCAEPVDQAPHPRPRVAGLEIWIRLRAETHHAREAISLFEPRINGLRQLVGYRRGQILANQGASLLDSQASCRRAHADLARQSVRLETEPGPRPQDVTFI